MCSSLCWNCCEEGKRALSGPLCLMSTVPKELLTLISSGSLLLEACPDSQPCRYLPSQAQDTMFSPGSVSQFHLVPMVTSLMSVSLTGLRIPVSTFTSQDLVSPESLTFGWALWDARRLHTLSWIFFHVDWERGWNLPNRVNGVKHYAATEKYAGLEHLNIVGWHLTVS